jgi:hypothetical protein
MSSATMTQRITEMSPRFLARMAAVLAVLEGVASVNGLAVGACELLLGLWLLAFGVNVERWKERAALGQ